MRGSFEQGARNRDALLLPARKGHALLADQGSVAIRERQDHVMDGGRLGGCFNFLVCDTSRPTP